MASQTKAAGTVVDSGDFANSWSNPSNATSSNDAYATVVIQVGLNERSALLKATNFSFSIPSGSTINGVSVKIERSETLVVGGVGIVDRIVQLIKGGSGVGNNKADTASEWPTLDTNATYGSSSDLWGLTFTVSDINASDFGVHVSVNKLNASGNDHTAQIDYIEITVSYDASSDISYLSDDNSPVRRRQLAKVVSF